MIYCGIDWAENTHDVALVDDTGQLLAKRHIADDATGYKVLLELLAEHGDTEENPLPVAIETSRGLLVAVLRVGKRKVYAINPMAAARYRDRHSVSRKKSDPGDALVLANILRTDMHAHRSLPDDSDLGRAIAVLARAQQDSLWNRQQLSNQLRSLLREYYPSALAAFATWANGLCRAEARELLKAAPTPTRAARLTRAQLQAALKRAGRKRGIESEADRLRDVFRAEWAHQPRLVEDALGKQMLALLRQLEAACIAADNLAEEVEKAFPQHPDAEILLSFPGLGIQLAARILAEIGDDHTRFADARGLKAYAGSSPITRAPARGPPSPAAGSRTTGSTTPATCGPSPPSGTRQGRTPITGGDARSATGTQLPRGTSSTASSASSTTASSTTSCSTSRRPSPPISPLSLDALAS